MEELIVSANIDSAEARLQENDAENSRLTSADVGLNEAMGTLTRAAAMAYGSGIGEKENGGKGNIGILNGKIIKFNTSAKEYNHKTDAVYAQMKESCDKLRCLLMMTAYGMSKPRIEDGVKRNARDDVAYSKFIARLSDTLGMERKRLDCGFYDASTRIKQDAGLLSRKAVAKAVTMIRDYLKATVKTYSKADLAAAERLGEGGKYRHVDFHIWRKVAKMQGLSSHGARDSFGKAQRAGVENALPEGVNVADLRRIGNEAAKEFDFTYDREALVNMTKGHGGYKTTSDNLRSTQSLSGEQLHNVARFRHVRKLAAGMDAMMNALRAKLGEANRERYRFTLNVFFGRDMRTQRRVEDKHIVNHMMRRALEKVCKVNRHKPENDFNTDEFQLTALQYQAVLAEMRDEMLKIAYSNLPNETDGDRLAKDFLSNMADRLDAELPHEFIAKELIFTDHLKPVFTDDGVGIQMRDANNEQRRRA